MRETTAALALLSCAFAFASCGPAHVAPRAAGGFVLVDDAGRGVEGSAAYTVRDGDPPVSVIAVANVGELLVAADGCRFVWTAAAVSEVRIVESRVPCAEVRDDRLCFDRLRLSGPAGSVAVDGCAERNELFLDRVGGVDGAGAATLAPRTLIERCAAIDKAHPAFIRVDDVRVDGAGDAPRRGVRFRWNGDGFDVCFLSGKSGRYRLDVTVDGAAVVLSGDVADL